MADLHRLHSCSDSSLCVAFVANRAMLAGLCASLGSLAVALRGKAHPPIFVYHSGLTGAVQTSLSAVLARTNPELSVEFCSLDVTSYLDLLPLQGDNTCYVRLGLPRLLPEFKKILYLDSDMVFTAGIEQLFDLDLCGRLFAASGVGLAKFALESDFFLRLGMKPETPVFNSGLLLIDSALWLHKNVEENCVRFGLEHRDERRSADQTILNSLYHAEFMPLPPEFNHPCRPWTKPDGDPVVYHFIGMPKPWDLLGFLLHRFCPLWRVAA